VKLLSKFFDDKQIIWSLNQFYMVNWLLTMSGTSVFSKVVMKIFHYVFVFVCLLSGSAHGFCGFYAGEGELLNRTSKVVLARNGDRTVLTMVNGYEGDVSEFALVVPIPSFIARENIRVIDPATIDHLDAYTAPRLVEYFDGDPCEKKYYKKGAVTKVSPANTDMKLEDAKSLAVTVEAEYAVGEYDVSVLSATQSEGLESWLADRGYGIPNGATEVLAGYIGQGMRFLVAKVNLQEQGKLTARFLRPLQIEFESTNFMLPIRLGTVNAEGQQELLVFTLTAGGRVESSNYRTVKIPANMDLPLYVRDSFDEFYPAMFAQSVKREGMDAVFLEYAWDMNWCDPCAANSLTQDELRELGVFWLDARENELEPLRKTTFSRQLKTFVTRLHVRYDAKTFLEDLMLRETDDRKNFQGRYVLRNHWQGRAKCMAGEDYLDSLSLRFEREAQALANLTGWDISDIRNKMSRDGKSFNLPIDDLKWYERIWR